MKPRNQLLSAPKKTRMNADGTPFFSSRLPQAVYEYLVAAGKATGVEAAEEFGCRKSIGRIISNLRARGLVRVAGWVREDTTGSRHYLRAQYAAGSAPDAQKPRRYTQKQRDARYAARQRARKRVPASVFHLGGLAAAEAQA